MSEPSENSGKWVVLGEVVAHFGIKGWLKIRSYTRPAEQILSYSEWQLISAENKANKNVVNRKVSVLDGKHQGKSLIVKLDGFDSREASQAVMRMQIAIDEEILQTLPDGEYYWRDLLGMVVINQTGLCFGKVVDFLETGANDVLIVNGSGGLGAVQENEVLIPWIDEVIVRVDEDNNQIFVNWDEGYL